MTGERVIRISVRTLAGLALFAMLLWPLDWLVWQIRVTAGGGMGSVVVSKFTVAELKANKEDYYFEGSGPVDCSESLFTHAARERAGGCAGLQR